MSVKGKGKDTGKDVKERGRGKGRREEWMKGSWRGGGELERRIVGVKRIIRTNLNERLELYKRMKIERRINSL